MRICSKCQQPKAESEFYQSRRRRSACKECEDNANRKWKLANPETHRRIVYNRDLRHRYNITADDYDRMLEEQGGVCAICKLPPTTVRLGVDHDHGCCPGKKSCGKCVRGLLCRTCNTRIGIVEGELMQPTLDYLADYT